MAEEIEGIDISRPAVRRLMETAFEPHGDGWVYYKSSWSKGVPVTAEERELFVADWTPEKNAEFHHRIAGRAPVTPARGLKPVATVLRALPKGVVWAIFTGALAALALSWEASPAWRIVLWSLAAAFLAISAAIFVVRRFRE